MASRGTAPTRRLVSTKSATEPMPASGEIAATGATPVAPSGAGELRRERSWGLVRLGVDLLLLAGAAVLVDALWSDGSSVGARVLWPALLAGAILSFSYLR